MSAINKAISDIMYQIPVEVLTLAFMPKKDIWNKAPVSLESHIKDKVICKRLLVDCNIVGGRIAMVPLMGIRPIFTAPFTTVFQIPKIRTQGVDVLSALSVNYYPYSVSGNMFGSSLYTSSLYKNVSNVTSVGQRIADSYSNLPVISSASCDLVGPNTIAVRDNYRQMLTYAFYLRCILENDKELNNINPRSWVKFSRLCVLATKSYIYNNTVVDMDKAQLYGGQELGIIKDIIDGYSDAEEQYQEYLDTKWQKIAYMNDSEQSRRMLKLMINPTI